jgi:SAM-dependent methyltransferase
MPTFTQGRCPLCAGERLHPVGRLDEAGSRIAPPPGSRIVSCAACDLLFVDPLPHWTADDFAALYGGDYFAPMPGWWHAVRAYTEPQRRFRNIAAHLATGERSVLEVGAGVYGFMARQLVRQGWRATAQEPALAFHERLRAADSRLTVTGTPFLELPAEPRYALVYADSVFEHVPNPGDYFAKARELLVPGGVLYLVSPNEHALVNRLLTLTRRLSDGTARMLCPYSESFHLVGYSPRSLAWAARAAGLELCRVVRRHDWRWLNEVRGLTSPLRYPRAAARWVIDRAGLGHNLEAALRRPS